MAERDILFAVKNNFYIGAYNNAINEASDLEGLTDVLQVERDVFVYRSYIALGSHDVSPRAGLSVRSAYQYTSKVKLYRAQRCFCSCSW